jgi:hypothetical protein
MTGGHGIVKAVLVLLCLWVLMVMIVDTWPRGRL